MMLTAKGEKNDRITGFNAGADDYLPKPFDPDELLSRVRAILRRSEAYQPTVLAYGDLTLDPGRGNLRCGRETIRLSGREFQIMELFFRNPGTALVREKILKGVWGENYFGDVKIVDVNIRRLRMKVEDEPSHPTHIMTVWGYGYRWEE
jgi:DNA-binding response OmpR family regulator